MNEYRKDLVSRYNKARTVPGTRSFHQFVPISSNSIGAKHVSEESEYSLVFNFESAISPHQLQLKISQFVVCLYDNLYWVGMITEIDDANEDVNINFMHNHLPTRSLKWPTRDDVCHVPRTHIICTIETPSLLTSTGRQYVLNSDDLKKTETAINS